jgi:hypothetical protein
VPGNGISFALTAAGPCRVEVLDASGRTVAVLADGWSAAGRHALSWNGRSDSGAETPPGIYFVALRTAGRSETRRIVRLR